MTSLTFTSVGEAHARLARAAGAEPDHRLVDLLQNRAAADDEPVARLGARLHALGSQCVVHDHEITHVGGPLHRPVLGLLLLQVRKGLVHLGLGERLGRVLDGKPGVLAERDGRLDLDHGRELQRRALLERDLLQVRLFHRLELRFREGLPVHLRNQVAGDLLADIIREVQLDHAARDLALAEAGQLGFPLHAGERARPCLLHDLGRLFHLQPALARAELLDIDFHRGSWNSGTRGGS